MVICLERGTDLHMAQLIPLPLTVSCCSKIKIGFTFLVPAHPRSPGKRAVKRVCVCVCVGGCGCIVSYSIARQPTAVRACCTNLTYSAHTSSLWLCWVLQGRAQQLAQRFCTQPAQCTTAGDTTQTPFSVRGAAALVAVSKHESH